jgi:hypothetical protein
MRRWDGPPDAAIRRAMGLPAFEPTPKKLRAGGALDGLLKLYEALGGDAGEFGDEEAAADE